MLWTKTILPASHDGHGGISADDLTNAGTDPAAAVQGRSRVSGPVPAGVSVDVGDRTQVEEALEQSERRLRALVNSIDEGYCLCEMIVDDSGDPVDYRILETNPLFKDMTGLEDPVGKTALELVPDLEPGWVEIYARVGLGGQTLRFERGSEAMGRWFDVFAVPVEPHGHFAVMFRDQTDRRRAEEALRESEQRFRTLADRLPLVVWQHDAAGRQDWVNDTYCRFFGVTRDEMREDRWQILTHPDDGPAYADEFAAAVAGQRVFHAEVRARRADGQWRCLESWAHPLFGPDDAFLGHIGTSADITDRKTAEAALRSAAARDAFRARLADTLRMVGDPIQVQADAVRVLGEHLGATRVHYVEVDESGEFGVVHADYHAGASSVVGRHRFGDRASPLIGDFLAGRTIVMQDTAHDARLTKTERAAAAELKIGACVTVPLIKQGRAVAALAVNRPGAHRWFDDELTIIADTAERIWTAVEHARAELALRIRHARAELVAELLSDLEKQPTVGAQLQRLAEILVPRFADYATVEGRDDHQLLGIAHRDPDQVETLRTLRRYRRLGPDDPTSIARVGGDEVRTGIVAAITDEYADDPRAAQLLARLEPRSHMTVPIDLGGGIGGQLAVGLTDPRRPLFSDVDLDFLRETAQRVGVVLAAARLRQEEHDISVRLQQALLPDELIWHPNVVIEARYHAASALLEVGGDWYDTFAWPDARIGIIVGDVVGHNLDSAATMGRLRAATAALAAHTEPSPAALIDALERCARGPDGTDFATAVCVIVDPATGRLAYSSAGHPPVLVIAPDGSVTRLGEAQSGPLCAVSVGARPEATIALEPGSLVIMYSDGLIERRRERLETGIARLVRTATGLIDQPIDMITDRLIADMAAHSPPEDDVVVACFRYTPVTSHLHRSIPAHSDHLARLRAETRTWLDHHDIGGHTQHDVLLGVGEACANAIEHAYHNTTIGDVDIDLTHHRYYLTVRVHDRGHWRPKRRRECHGGRGTDIMRTVATHFRRHHGPDGTTVTLTVPVPIRQETPLP